MHRGCRTVANTSVDLCLPLLDPQPAVVACPAPMTGSYAGSSSPRPVPSSPAAVGTELTGCLRQRPEGLRDVSLAAQPY